MINAEELAICRRRGHDFGGAETPPTGAGWKQCKSCGMWLRQDSAIREREDEPPQTEINPFEWMRWSTAVRPKEINAGELALCRLRRHNLGHSQIGLSLGWAQCEWCGLWLREERTIIEREDDPPEAGLNK